MAWLLVLLTLIYPAIGSAADWSQGTWQILYASPDDSLMTIRGLDGADGAVHLVVMVQDSSGMFAYRYLCYSPTGEVENVNWPQDLSYHFREMNYDSVDRMRPAFLSQTMLWRQTPQGWDSLNLAVFHPGFPTPQSFSFDSTGALHYVLYGGSSVLYCRDGGGRPARQDTIECPFEVGCSGGNAAKLYAPRAEGILLAVGWDDNLISYPNFWALHFYHAIGDAPLSHDSALYDDACYYLGSSLSFNSRGEWMFGLMQMQAQPCCGFSHSKVWRGDNGLPLSMEMPLPDVNTGTYRIFVNQADSTFEFAARLMDQSPTIVQFARYNPEWQLWESDTTLPLPTDHPTFHVQTDSLGRGHLFTVDSTHLWYFGPESIDDTRSFALHPSSFSLSAFPNPFNPTTTLSFSLPTAGVVTLSVFDVTGREVKTLLNGTMNAGEHEITFDGNALPSGIYFVQLQAAKMSRTMKMALLR